MHGLGRNTQQACSLTLITVGGFQHPQRHMLADLADKIFQ